MRLAVVSLGLVASACVTPALPQPNADDADGADAAPPPDAAGDCEVLVESVGTGHHNPGQPCLECHNGQQQGAPIFTIGGTAYKDTAGTIPVIGATVIIIDGNGTVAKLPTQRNGNFYTSAQLVPPYVTALSRCPDTVPMLSNFVDGDCNSCHNGGGDPGRVLFDP